MRPHQPTPTKEEAKVNGSLNLAFGAGQVERCRTGRLFAWLGVFITIAEACNGIMIKAHEGSLIKFVV
jgi:hypothetical protein